MKGRENIGLGEIYTIETSTELKHDELHIESNELKKKSA